MLPTKQMIAKYDYDSRQLSPNVDAEQVNFKLIYLKNLCFR
jgi:hypothetical protein